MSYCRLSDESDVYVYGARTVLVCCRCSLTGEEFSAEKRTEMVRHLDEHVRAKHSVPKRVFGRLKEEIREEGDIYGRPLRRK